MALAGVVAVGGCADPQARFTGLWKSNCEDYWGVQIKPAGEGLYAVTFCGLAGCMAPGAWMPNTRVVGDPLYEVHGSSKIGIKRNELEHFVYYRCNADPAWPEVSASN